MANFFKKAKRSFNKAITKLLYSLSQNEGTDVEYEKYVFEGMPELVREAAAEGCVLLKNNGALPLQDGGEVAVFGRVQSDYFYVGYGSGGDVRAPYRISLLQGLRENGKVRINEELAAVYEKWIADNPVDHGFWGNWPRFYPEMPLDDALVGKAATTSKTAIVVIGRAAGEDRENALKPGSYYLTKDEMKMLETVTYAFEKTVVVLNIGNIIDLSWTEKFGNSLSSVLLAWQGGMDSGRAVSDVLTGIVPPSGKLNASVAKRYENYPSAGCYGNKKFNNYVEDVFVGYRYFETFDKDSIQYPFGFGLTYTKFDISLKNAVKTDKMIKLSFVIENIGDFCGKEVIEIYAVPPIGKLSKPVRNLVAFAKTQLLETGEKQALDIEFSVDELASYDDSGITGKRSAWVLEEGKYVILAGEDVRSAYPVFEFEVPRQEVVRQLSEVGAPAFEFKRLAMGRRAGDVFEKESENVPTRTTNLKAIILENLPAAVQITGDRGIKLADVKSGKATMDEFVAQLDLTELEAITRGDYTMNSPLGAKGNAGALGGVLPSMRDKGIPAVITSDGPSGIRLHSCCSLIPIGASLACTWNPALVEKMYKLAGKEMKVRGTDILLAPGMNIYRDPLCGRNFEYFSEDPLLSGKMAAAVVRGIQSAGVSACPKHYACNNQEYNRLRNDSRVSERALREIYLKGFEICVKDASPQNIMTSYNKINGVWGHYNYELVTLILRGEWGYKGNVMTDWWMRRSKSPEFPRMRDQAYRVRAQVDVLMPGGGRTGRRKPDGTLLETFGKADGLTLGELQRSAKNVLNFVLDSHAFIREE